LDEDSRKETLVEHIEAAFYARMPGYPEAITYWIRELGEMALKATARGDRSIAAGAATAIVRVAVHFLEQRRENLILTPAPDTMFLVPESDTKVVLTPAYETLREIFNSATAKRDEAIALRVCEAYATMAIFTAALKAPSFRNHSAPLTYEPIAYMVSCIDYAQGKGLDEVPVQGGQILRRVALSVPKSVEAVSVHIPVADALHKIAFGFFVQQKYVFGAELVGDLMQIPHHLLDQDDAGFEDVLRHVLRGLETLVPVATASELMQGRLMLMSSVGKAYALTSPQSLAYLVAKATKLIKVEPGREWVDPYRDFHEVCKVCHRHLRALADKVDFGGSWILWELIGAVKHMSQVLIQVIRDPVRRGHDDERRVASEMMWALSFLWAVFKDKKTVDHGRAEEACDVLAYVSLQLAELNYVTEAEECARNISSIIGSCSGRAPHLGPYDFADLLMAVWQVRLFAKHKGLTSLVVKLDELLDTKPDGLSVEMWGAVKEAVCTRKRQLSERLKEHRDWTDIRDDAASMLGRLLVQSQVEA
jgi:hypothetical protein